MEVKKFNIGSCGYCHQGLLEIVMEEKTGHIFICCDECDVEWDDPEDALEMENATRFKYGKIIYPTEEQARELNWKVPIYQHTN